MNIQQLTTFITVVDTKSFSEAARRLGISQPAVTMQVQNLENDMNQTLLDRHYRHIELTEAGAVLLPYARTMIAESDRARAELNALSGEVSGPLTVALSTTPGDYIVPRLLGGFVEQYPNVLIRLVVGSTGEVVTALENREADLGMVGALSKSGTVEFEKLGHDELILIAPLDFSEGGPCDPARLTKAPWVVRSGDSGTQAVVKRFLRAHKVTYGALDIRVQLGTGEAVVNAVEGGLGIAIVSRYVAEKALRLGTIREVPCEGLPLERSFYLALPKRTLTRAASAFIEHLTTNL